MKKIMFSLIMLFAFCNVLNADNERVITIEDLPKNSQAFVNTYFGDATIQYVKVKISANLVQYTVNFTEGREVQFNKSGKWIEITCKKTPIPDGIVPAKITAFVEKNYPDNHIEKIEHNERIYEVDLDNGMEIVFNKSFRPIDINY